jgi:glutaminyl-peptide cyclotransferase
MIQSIQNRKFVSYTFSLLVCIIFIGISCKSKTEVAAIPYTVVKIFPHDMSAFTQGLVIEYGRLFESTGQEGASWIAEVELASGRQDKKVLLADQYFGEGITILNRKIYQLTWKGQVGFVYDINSFQKINEFQYEHEGWGITHDGKNLIVSDGTDKIHLLDTATLKEIAVINIKQGSIPVDKLNELEFIEGYLYANRWMTNEVLKIDLSDGSVAGILDLTELAREANQRNPSADVLNGIAYEKKSGLLLVTGKWWPLLFALRLENVKSK